MTIGSVYIPPELWYIILQYVLAGHNGTIKALNYFIEAISRSKESRQIIPLAYQPIVKMLANKFRTRLQDLCKLYPVKNKLIISIMKKSDSRILHIYEFVSVNNMEKEFRVCISEKYIQIMDYHDSKFIKYTKYNKTDMMEEYNREIILHNTNTNTNTIKIYVICSIHNTLNNKLIEIKHYDSNSELHNSIDRPARVLYYPNGKSLHEYYTNGIKTRTLLI